MSKITNMAEVRSTAIAFLYLDVEKTNLSPVIVHHPFTITGVVWLKDEKEDTRIANILEDENDLKLWRKGMQQMIERAKNVFDIATMIVNAYKLTFIKYIKDNLSQKDLSKLLGMCWSLVEQSNMDNNVSKEQLVFLFARCDPKYLMDEEEYAVYEKLPKTLTVYRGVTSYNSKNIRALSWTLKQETARWFSERFGEWRNGERFAERGTVYSAQIEKQHIFAYFNGRNEDEIVLDPAFLQNITLVE